MKTRTQSILSAFLVICLLLVLGGCSSNFEPASQQGSSTPAPAPDASQQPAPAPAPGPTPEPAPAMTPAAPASSAISVAGIEFAVPKTWAPQPERPMRFATYSIPAATGDTEGGECAVFYFGSGQGGDVRANINRWIGQFTPDSKPEESSRAVNGIQVTTVKVSGSYKVSGGPMMQSSGEKAGYRLLGTIVEGPEGPVFFKATGPAATINAAEADITALVDSIHKIGQ